MAITQHEALGWEGRWGKLKKKPCIKFKGVEQPVGGGGWGWGWGGNPKIMNVILRGALLKFISLPK